MPDPYSKQSGSDVEAVSRDAWGLADLEAAAGLNSGGGHALVEALRAAPLIEVAGRGTWVITQAGQTFSSATAAKLITRVTAERALAQFLERVRRVEQDPYFLARVTRVVLFGSMLNPEVQRLSDVDVAVELVPKEVDYERARALNRRRVEELSSQGRQFRNFLEVEHWWHRETFQFLKGGSRVIALADYAAEKSFVSAVPHRVLIGTPEQIPAEHPVTIDHTYGSQISAGRFRVIGGVTSGEWDCTFTKNQATQRSLGNGGTLQTNAKLVC